MTAHITRGSGNVFADIGVKEPEDALLRAQLVSYLQRLIDARGLTQTAAAQRIGIAQGDLSKLLRGRTSGFSVGRLLGLAQALGGDVEIKLHTSEKDRKGHLRVLEVA